MASILKAQKANASKADAKGKGKRNADDMDVDQAIEVPAPKKRNKQRVLLLSSRGITHRMRHFMNDLEALLPQVKKGAISSLVWKARCHILTVEPRLETRLKIPAPSPARTRRSEQLQ